MQEFSKINCKIQILFTIELLVSTTYKAGFKAVYLDNRYSPIKPQAIKPAKKIVTAGNFFIYPNVAIMIIQRSFKDTIHFYRRELQKFYP